VGEICIVTGNILLNDIESFRLALRVTKLDGSYPLIVPEMFSVGASKEREYYEHTIVSFAATYKNVEDGSSWSEFVLKFEHLLNKVDFDIARIHLETEFLGDYHFFWGAKRSGNYNPYNKSDMIECPRWYFGYGFRHMFGSLHRKDDLQLVPSGFDYPIQFDEETKVAFNDCLPKLNAAEPGTPIFFSDLKENGIDYHHYSYLILTYLEINGVIETHYDRDKGPYIKRLKEIKPLTTPYDTTSYL